MWKNPALNKWGLFWLVAGAISAVMLVAMARTELSTAAGVSAMIGLSVRFAVPWLFLVFAASALQSVFPSRFSRWLLANRKYFGLVYAAAMAWQGFFILWLLIVHSDYYVTEIYVMRDAIEGTIGYAFLLAMTITSFPFARRRMRARHWRLLHVSGIYFLWAYAFSVYWWALFYYGNPVFLDYVYYVLGLAAWGLRVVAWGKRNRRRLADRVSAGRHRVPRLTGVALVALGLITACSGALWRPLAERVLYGYSFTQIPELYLPYWPFEPFLALAILAPGVALISRSQGISIRPDAGKRLA
jgi:hypothetical protein